jgi:hypothetical protein
MHQKTEVFIEMSSKFASDYCQSDRHLLSTKIFRFEQGKKIDNVIIISVTRKLNKILPNFWKKWPINTKISTSKLNLRAHNIHIKVRLKPSNKPWVETACLGEKG